MREAGMAEEASYDHGILVCIDLSVCGSYVLP
jgi:hypothetical protein